MKRLYAVIGALLILLGAVVLLQGVSFSKNETVLQIGGLKAQVKRDEPVPQWAGVLAVVAGLVLVGVGMKR
jgi:drug/metabolite transporter (DMT)-like permease